MDNNISPATRELNLVTRPPCLIFLNRNFIKLNVIPKRIPAKPQKSEERNPRNIIIMRLLKIEGGKIAIIGKLINIISNPHISFHPTCSQAKYPEIEKYSIIIRVSVKNVIPSIRDILGNFIIIFFMNKLYQSSNQYKIV